MNKRKILTFITALTMGMTSFATVPMTATAEDTSGAAASDTETPVVTRKGDISFDFSADLPSMYTGDEPNLDDAVLWVTTYDNMGYSSILHDIGSFTVGSGRYSDMYTIDTSEVDNTQEGKYLVTLRPKAGASFREDNDYNTTYDITLQGKESYRYIMVYDKDKIKDTPLYLRFYTEDIEITRGQGTGIELCGAMASDVKYEVNDETIAKVSENSSSKYLGLEALKEGETTVNVYTSDGRSTSEKIRVTPPSATTVTQTPPVTTTTTLADPNATTTRQTTTTIATVYKWWYDYSSYTTTTAVYTMPATTTTAIGCWAPKIEFDTSPMEIGEVREGRFYNPETKMTENGAVHTTSNNIKIEYTKGSDTFKVTALKAGSANISFYERECALSGSLNITVAGEPEPPVSQTTTLPTVKSSTTTTKVLDNDQLDVDFAPTVDFETSDMKIGEVRRGRFYNPISKKSTGGNIKFSDNVSVEWDKDGNFKVTALKAGGASLEITESNCPFVAHVSFNINENESEITRIQPYATTTTTTTVNVITTTTADTSQGTYCSYDGTPLNAGQKISLGFGCTNKDIPVLDGGSVESDSDNIIVSYNSGLNSFEVTAVKEGTGHVYAEARGADTGIDIYINVVSDSKLKGDANCDGGMDMADVVYIMQSLANPDKYKLSKFGRENADLDGNGVTVGDAQKIQRKLLGYDDVTAPTTPITQPIGVKTADEAISLIKNYDLNDYYEGYRDSLEDMFGSFRKDGYIYRFTDEAGEKAIRLDSDREFPVYLMPRMDYEDKGIVYNTTTGVGGYQVCFYFKDPEYADLDMKDYIAKRLNIKESRPLGDKYIIAEFGDSDLMYANVFFSIDDEHYCKVRSNASESEMTSFLSMLFSEKLSLGLGEEKMTDLNDINNLLLAYSKDNKLPVSMRNFVREDDKLVYVYLTTFDYKKQKNVEGQMKVFMKSMNIDEELVSFAFPQVVAD